MKNHLISCALLVALFSCGKKSGQNSGGSPNPADGSGPSLSREDALNQMSPEQRAHLEKWQNSPEKDCNAVAILNGAISGEYVDLNLISSKLENNSLAKLPDGKWAILSPGSQPGGLQTTKHNSGQQVNGQSVNKIDIQTSRDGGVCEVKIFGATVAKIQLATGISYLAFGNADKNTEIVVERFDSQNPSRAAQVFTNFANPLSRAFNSHFLFAKPADLESLALFVNIKKEKIKNFQSSSALVLPAQENWAPFAFSNQYLSIKGDSSLAAFRFLESTTFQIVMPAMAWTPESAKVLWTLPVIYSAEKMSTSGSVKFKLNSDKNNFLPVVRESNNKDAISCLKSRLFVLKNEAEPFQVSFDNAAGSCSILLKSNYENAFLQDDKEFLPKMFKNVSPQRNISLNGWDSIFVSLLEKIWESKGAEKIVENVATTEVSGVELPIASKFQQNAILVEGAWQNSGELFRPTLIQKTRYLASSWTLRFFEQAPDTVVLNRVFKAAEATFSALPEISNDIIASQAELPNEIPKGIENLENMSADFLKNIVDYRTTLKLFKLDRSLPSKTEVGV